MADSAEIAQQNRADIARRQGSPRTEYVLKLKPGDDYSTTDAQPSRPQVTNRIQNFSIRHSSQQNQSSPLMSFLTHPHLISGAWMVSMAIVSVDEWKRNHIFPRPSRLWWTTMTYALLGALSISQFMAPLAGALAIGYTITLLWQYYNGTGQFTTEATLV